MKKFFSISPYQPPSGLKKAVYEATDNSNLFYNKEISFPILSVINAYAENNEEIEVYTIVPEYKNSKDNYEEFKKQIAELESEKNLKIILKEIAVEYSDSLDTMLDLFQKMIDCVDENDKIYMCVTFGSKPLSIVQMMAVNYAYRVFKNIRIGAIAYGKFDHNSKKSIIFDETSLFYMDEIVRTLAQNGVKNPKEIIKMFINNKDSEV